MSDDTAGGVGFQIETFPSNFSSVVQHVAERCHVAKSLCRVSVCIAAVFLSMFKRINGNRYQSSVMVSLDRSSS